MRRCLKHGGGGAVNNPDRISDLPEALLLQILALLPTKDVVATSVLSKQWKTIWKLVSKLKFDNHMNQIKHETFSENVFKVLRSNKAPFLESLHLCVRYDAMDTRKWIEIACEHHLRELVIDVKGPINFKLPKSLYNCETLETLILKNWVLVDIPSQVCLKSLRTLHLCLVIYNDNASVLNLLSGCPNLENLVVKRCIPDHVRPFTIAVPSLQRLEIYEMGWDGIGEEDFDYVINAPSLKYLKIDGNRDCLRFNMVEISSKLVEASITDLFTGINEELMRSLTSIKRLSLALSPLEINFPSIGTIFHQLVYLELSTNKVDWWNLFTRMLDTSPRLQVIKLIGTSPRLQVIKLMGECSGKVGVACGKWNQPKNVPECLLHHLELFVWIEYKKEQLEEEEKEVAKYILGNANLLKKANISLKGFNSEERLKMLQELTSVVKASNSSSCHIFVE